MVAALFLVLATIVGVHGSEWACSVPSEMPCPQDDELPRERGCQVRCGPGPDCRRGARICAKLAECAEFSVNSERTWATLKQLKARHGELNDVECPGMDEQLNVPGCQLRCKTPGGRCLRADAACRRLSQCSIQAMGATTPYLAAVPPPR